MKNGWMAPVLLLSFLISTVILIVLWIGAPALGLGSALVGTGVATALTLGMAFAFSHGHEAEPPRDR